MRQPFLPGALGILGHPVAHSLSPLIHNTALHALGHEPRYVACDVIPADLESAIRGLTALGFAGANVTIPHKEAVLPLVDRLTDRARAVGAVNTLNITRSGGIVAIEGDNTDEAGFAKPLEPFGGSIAGRDVVVFGAGGAARAVLYALLTRFSPRRLTVLSRRPEQAEALCAAFRPRASACGLLAGTLPSPHAGRLAGAMGASAGGATDATHASTSQTAFALAFDTVRTASLVVNTTPLGMIPHAESTPWADVSAFSAGQLVYDLVYRPAETRLMRDARTAGAQVIGGLPMLIAQAAVAFEGWTGTPMPVDEVTQAIKAALERE